MKALSILPMLLAAMQVSGTMAATPAPELDQIKAQQLQIRSGVIAGTDRYKDMPAGTRTELLSRQDRLLRMIGDKHDPSELTKDQRLEAFNTLEWMEATINKTEGERMVCARGPRLGSHQMSTVCRTQQQIDEAHDRARRQTSEGNMPLEI